jgi:hypothetical protein
MNIKNPYSIPGLLLILLATLSSCDHPVHMETTVHEDGSLDKTIVLESNDTLTNFIGIGPHNGWKLTVDSIVRKDNKKEEDKKWKLTFTKSFASAGEANQDLAAPNDTLFRVSSQFEKSFRWFYTYIYYSDTYHCINRMDLPIDDYVTQEDFAFIERLPAEGAPISKADKLYLDRLHEKLFDIYGIRAVYERHYNINVRLMKEAGMEARWIDTLQKHKEPIFRWLQKNDDVHEDFLYDAMDSLGIPFPYDRMEHRYRELYKIEDAKTNFSNHASEGIYTHVINMPWDVVRTNADSIAGNRLIWKPSSMKFTLGDYTMYAEARKENYWAMIISAMVVLFTIYLLFPKPRK